MARADNAYSRFVAWVKIILPVMALVLLASLFMFQQVDQGAQPLPFTEVELEQLARGQGIGGPNYSGLTEEGRALSLEADSAFPRLGNRRVVDAQSVRAVLESGAHGDITLVAQAAVIDQETSQAQLTGGVLIETGSGYRVVTETLRSALDRTDAESGGPAQVTGPGLELQAGGMHLMAKPDEPESVILVFKDGVDLIYTPQSR